MCSLTVQRLGVSQVLLELFIQVFTDPDVLEHPLQFGRVLKAARLLQEETTEPSAGTGYDGDERVQVCAPDLELGDHAGLRVVTGAVLVDQTFGEHLRVELLENVFVLDVLEYDHLGEEDAHFSVIPTLAARRCASCTNTAHTVNALHPIIALISQFRMNLKAFEQHEMSLKRLL